MLGSIWTLLAQTLLALAFPGMAGESELAKAAKDKADTEDKLASLAAAIDEMSAW